MSTRFYSSRATASVWRLLHQHALVAPALIAGFVLRFATLGHEALWVDETITLYFIRTMSYPELFVDLPVFQPHLPLFYIVLKAWTDVVGRTPVAARMLAGTFSTATIAGMFLVGRDLYDRQTGGLVAFLVALNPFLIHYGQFARMYSLLACLTAFSMWSFIHVRRGGNVHMHAVYFVATTLLVWTHYFALLVPLVQVAVLARDTQHDSQSTPHLGWWPYAAVAPSVLLVGMLIAAKVVGDVGVGSAQQVGHIPTPPSVEDVLKTHLRLVTGYVWHYANLSRWLSAALDLVAPLAVLLAGHVAAREYSRVDRVAVAWYLIPVVALFTVSYLLKPVWLPKYLGVATLGLLLLVARGIRQTARRRQIVLTVVLVAGLAAPIAMTVTTTQIQQYDDAAETVASQADGDDVVLLSAGVKRGAPLSYYFTRVRDQTDAKVVIAQDRMTQRMIRQHANQAGDDVWVVVEHSQTRFRDRAAGVLGGLTPTARYHGISVYKSQP